ncbi:hypothetical protein P4056_14775 [Pseudomonas aeruginosa]|nr:hypothetical protein [Pseudomonas aeruginosa]
MPEIIVTRPFNYREGLDATHYPASEGRHQRYGRRNAHALGRALRHRRPRRRFRQPPPNRPAATKVTQLEPIQESPMLQTIDRSFIGEGIIHARLYGSQEPFLPLGNCDTFNISFAARPQDATQPHGRRRQHSNVRERVTDVTSSIGMFDLTAENVALVTRSTIQVAPTAAITDEAYLSGVALWS